MDMIQRILNWFWPDKLFGAVRDPRWPKLRDWYFSKNLFCEICGKRGKIIHHIYPFFLFPELELSSENLITVCDFCHLNFAHLGSFHSYEKDIKKIAKMWQEKRKNRP